MNIAKNSKFNIDINYRKSHGSYIFDNKTSREYLDFFGMYASLPLGYNHEIFQTEKYKKAILETSAFKVNNCEFVSEYSSKFDQDFTEYASRGKFKHFHYCCTGALAVEAAIKTSLQYKSFHPLKVLSYNNSFHGINSYSGFITSRFWPVTSKLDGLPDSFSLKIEPDLEATKKALENNDITCILVEPIQCSVGDIHLNKEFLNGLRELADDYDVPLIFDEIQIGFGGTGKLWFYEHLDIVPDIVVFGKKTQLSGIMAKEKFSDIFKKENITRLEVTWNSDVVDMVRCSYIIEAYKNFSILENVKKTGSYMLRSLKNNECIQNVRGQGMIIAFDLESSNKRDQLVKDLFNNGLLCNPTGKKSIRLRPNLALTKTDAEKAIEKIKYLGK